MSNGRVSTEEQSRDNLATSRHRELAYQPVRSAGPRWLPLIAVIAVTTVYVLTAPGNRTEADDAFWFADDIERGDMRELLGDKHSAHLLFLPVARAIFNLLRLFIEVRAYEVIRLCNCLIAAMAVVLFGTVLRKRFHLSTFASVSGAAGLALSYGVWRYANETEVYAVAVLGLVALCLIGFSGLRSTTVVITAGAVAAVGALIHILGVIPALVVVPFVLLLERRLRDMAVYFLTFALITGAISYGAYRFAASPRQSFGGYLLGQSPGTSYGVRAIPQSMISVGQDIATSNFLFAYSSIARRVVAAFPMQYLMEEQYAGERAASIVRIVPSLTVPLLLALAAALVWLVRRRLLERTLPRDVTVSLAAVTVWILAYWLIVVGRSSSAPEAWIPLLPAVWICIAVVVFERARIRKHRALVVALLVVLAVHNLTGGFWMMRSSSTDFNAVKVGWLLDHAGSGDVILTADGAVFERYLRYYSAAEVISLEGLSSNELSEIYIMAVRQHGRIFATAGVFDPPSQLGALYPATFRAMEEFASSIKPDFRKAVASDLGDVYLRR
jgi:hypothetical protein